MKKLKPNFTLIFVTNGQTWFNDKSSIEIPTRKDTGKETIQQR